MLMNQNVETSKSGLLISKIIYYVILFILFFIVALGVFTKHFIHETGVEPENQYHNHTESTK